MKTIKGLIEQVLTHSSEENQQIAKEDASFGADELQAVRLKAIHARNMIRGDNVVILTDGQLKTIIDLLENHKDSVSVGLASFYSSLKDNIIEQTGKHSTNTSNTLWKK